MMLIAAVSEPTKLIPTTESTRRLKLSHWVNLISKENSRHKPIIKSAVLSQMELVISCGGVLFEP